MFNDADLLVAAAVEGFRILYILEDVIAAPIADGRPTRLLGTHPVRTAATDGLLGVLASYLPRKASTPS